MQFVTLYKTLKHKNWKKKKKNCENSLNASLFMWS